MTQTSHDPWLNRFATLTAAATLALIGVGGLVTSHGAGLAVPDWPTTYGYNMFLFPPSYWIGGIFYEHTHRLFASFVGLLTTVLTVWLWLREPRRWLRWLGVAAFLGVVAQGVLGGLRVTLLQNYLGIVHATIAHLFLVLVSFIAWATSRHWIEMARNAQANPPRALRYLLAAGTVAVFLQLILGATMRHQHAGLAIPDFPLAYGKLWPPMDEVSIEAFNRKRIDVRDPNPITAFQIGLHMVHRIGALITLATVGLGAWLSRTRLSASAALSKFCAGWFLLVFLQAALGAFTVWSNKAADVATAHVALGASSLVFGALLWGTVCRFAVSPSQIVLAMPETSSTPVSAARAKTVPSLS